MPRYSGLRLPVLLVVVFLALAGGPAPVLAQTARECDHATMIHADIDIRPGVSPNVIVVGSRGVLPVVLFGSEDVHVRGVDLETVGLHPMGRCENAAPPVTHAFADINRDGYEDMVVAFGIRDLTMFNAADTEACLHGDTVDGKHFCGHDAVEVRTTR